MRLAPGTRRYYLSGSPTTFVQAKLQEFDGLTLMVVDIAHTTNPQVKERCLHRLKPLSEGCRRKLTVGEIVVVSGARMGSLRLVFRAYQGGMLASEYAVIPTADLGRIIDTVG